MELAFANPSFSACPSFTRLVPLVLHLLGACSPCTFSGCKNKTPHQDTAAFCKQVQVGSSQIRWVIYLILAISLSAFVEDVTILVTGPPPHGEPRVQAMGPCRFGPSRDSNYRGFFMR